LDILATLLPCEAFKSICECLTLTSANSAATKKPFNKTNNKIFVLISDGELNEGTTWESLLFATFHKLDNLIIIVDYNKIQSLDFTKNILKLEPLGKKFDSFSAANLTHFAERLATF
jgi:transketolase N-terminal domain/subunit